MLSQLAGNCIPGLVAAGVAPAGGQGGWQRGAPGVPQGAMAHWQLALSRAGCLAGLAASPSGAGTSRTGVSMETPACDLKTVGLKTHQGFLKLFPEDQDEVNQFVSKPFHRDLHPLTRG